MQYIWKGIIIRILSRGRSIKIVHETAEIKKRERRGGN